MTGFRKVLRFTKNVGLLGLLILLPMMAKAQGWAIQGQAVDSHGKPLSFALVRVCPYTASGTPCSPLASLWSDIPQTHSISNPYTTDATGNYSFVVGSGQSYLVQVSAGGTIYSYLYTAGLDTSATIIEVNGTATSPVSPVNFVDSGTVTWTRTGATISAAAGNALTLQHNSVNLTDQALLNFDDTTPAAPGGYQNVIFQTSTDGKLSAYALPSNDLLQSFVPPVSGQWVVVYPTSFTPTINCADGNCFANGTNSSGNMGITGGGGTSNHLQQIVWNWSAASLTAAGITQSQVVHVYPFVIAALSSWGAQTPIPQITCPNLTTLSAPFGMHQITSPDQGAANIATFSCSAVANASVSGTKDWTFNIPLVGLFVYYTGSPVPTPASVNVGSPLFYNPTTNILGLSLPYEYTQDTGSTNALIVSNQAYSTLSNGTRLEVQAAHTTTSSAPTLQLNLGLVQTIVGPTGGALSSGDISTSNLAILVFYGGQWYLQNPQTSGGGSGSVSGQAAGVVGLGGTATSITSQSHINENTPGQTTVTQKLAVSSASDPSQMSMTYNSGHALVPGSSTTAVFGPDSGGNGMMSEAGGAAARICDATNGVCGGGSSTVNPVTCTANSANDICLTQAPYYASPAGATTTTVTGTFAVGTSGTIGSCSTFLTNEGVLIAGAGAAGANYIGTVVSCSGTTLTVTPATSTAVSSSNVVWHDETAAFNAAIGTVTAAGQWVKIWLPDGMYRVNGPLLDTSGANAILPMPKLPNYTGAPAVVEIRGFSTPDFTQGSTSAIISTGSPSGNLFGGYDSAAGGGFPNFTNVWLKMQNVTLRSYSNPGVTMMNGKWLMAFQGEHVVCDVGAEGTPHTNAGACYILPTVDNNVNNDLTDVNCNGYQTCFQLTEHTHVTRGYAVNATNGWVIDSGGSGSNPTNSVSIDYLWDENVTNDIVGPASGSEPVPVNIQNADLEGGTTNISDPNNKLQGVISYNIPYGSTALTVSGATNVQKCDLRLASPCGAGGFPLTIGSTSVAANSTTTSIAGLGLTASTGVGMASSALLGFNSDTCASRDSAGVWDFGGCTAGSKTGTLQAAVVSAGTNMVSPSFVAPASGTATNVANFNSGAFGANGSYWTGATSNTDSWSWSNVLGTGANPTSTLTFTHTGSSGAVGVSVPSLAVSGLSGSSGDCVQLGTGGLLTAAAGACGTGGGGSSVTVNGGSAFGTANLNDTTPAAAAGGVNVKWQSSGNNISAYNPAACMVPMTVTAGGSSSTLTFSSIPATCTDLTIRLKARGTTGSNGTNVAVTFNSDTTSGHYYDTNQLLLSTTASAFPGGSASTTNISTCNVPGGSDPTDVGAVCIMEIPGYAQTSQFQDLEYHGWGVIGAVSSRMAIMFGGGEWTNGGTPAAINTITLTIASGNFATGSSAVLVGH